MIKNVFGRASRRTATGAVDGRVASQVLGGLLLGRQDGDVRRAFRRQLQELGAVRQLLRIRHMGHAAANAKLRAAGRRLGNDEGPGAQPLLLLL